jgi:hypothetical protein
MKYRQRTEELFKSTSVAGSNSNNIGSDQEFFWFEYFIVQEILSDTSTLHLIYLSYLSWKYKRLKLGDGHVYDCSGV